MTLLLSLLGQIALLLLVLAGLATIVGFRSARDGLVRWALALFGITLIIPYLTAAVGRLGYSTNTGDITNIGYPTSTNTEYPDDTVNNTPVVGNSIPAWLLALVGVGHLVLAVVLVRRHLRGPDHTRRVAGELDAIRRRGRERVGLPHDPPEGGVP